MKHYTVENTTLSISGWAERAGISRQAMASRVRKAANKEELKRVLTAPAEQGSRTDLKKKGR